MSYKTDIEKGFKLLRCISPPIIFVNGPYCVGKTNFINKFKKEGFSVLIYDDYVLKTNSKNVSVQDVIYKYLLNRKQKKQDHTPIIIEANINDENVISNIFKDDFHNFTYVYMYPNNSENYMKNIENKLKYLALLESEPLDQTQTQSQTQNNNNKKENKKENNPVQILTNEYVKLSKDYKTNQNQCVKIVKKITVDLMQESKKIYQNHLEFFEDKILTILI